jgi:hypothetical protein
VIYSDGIFVKVIQGKGEEWAKKGAGRTIDVMSKNDLFQYFYISLTRV